MKIITETSQLSVNPFIDSKILSIDSETTGLSPISDKIRLLQISNRKETWVIDCFRVSHNAIEKFCRPMLESLDVVKIFHNAKFDIGFIKQNFNIEVEKIFDTFLASYMIECGIRKPKGYHGLGNLVERELGIVLDKEEQKSDWSGLLTDSQIAYAAKDVEYLFEIREKQIKKLKELGLVRCAKMEFDAVAPTSQLELNGFYLDFNQWVGVAKDCYKKAQESANQIYAILDPYIDQQDLFGLSRINLNSSKQVFEYFTKAGVPLEKSTSESAISHLAGDYKLVELLLDYRGHMKNFSTYGESYGQYINPVSGRIHASFFQPGTETGRYSVFEPNLNAIPSDALHRNCFKAMGKDKVLVSGDVSQEELRILADFSQDENFIKIFESDHDAHSGTASQVFNKPLDQVTKELRDLAKRVNFGIVYGIGVTRLAHSAGISMDEAKRAMKRYFNTFSKIKAYLDYQKFQVLQSKSARTASGRLVKYEFDLRDDAQTAAAQRYAANCSIQGTAADILKTAMRLFYDRTKDKRDKIKLVNIVHDEMVVESDRDCAEEANYILKNSLLDAGDKYLSTVKLKVDMKHSDFWDKG